MDILIVFFLTVPIFIVVHELGHCLVARWCGVPVERMRVFTGPAWYKWMDRRGTEFCLGVIPGAFAEIAREVWNATPPFKRMLIASGGPAANLASALLPMLVAYTVFGQPPQAVIGNVVLDGAAHRAGLHGGDVVVAVDGKETESWTDVGLRLVPRLGDTGAIEFTVERGGEELLLAVPVSGWQAHAMRISLFESLGISPDEETARPSGIVSGLVAAVADTWRMFWNTAMAGFQMIFGDLRITNFIGGLQVVQIGADARALAVNDYLLIAALFAVGFAVINLLPGPVVDGHALLMGAAEWIRGKPFSAFVGKITLLVGIVLAFGPLAICLTYELLRMLA